MILNSAKMTIWLYLSNLWMDFIQNCRKCGSYTMEVLLKDTGVFNNSFSLCVCLSIFHTYIKKKYEGRRLWKYDLYISYIHTWYFQYMKEYPWDLLYFKRFRGQTLEVIWGHDKLKIYRIKIQTQWCNFANIYSYGHQEWYSIEENISRIIWSHQGTGSKEIDFF